MDEADYVTYRFVPRFNLYMRGGYVLSDNLLLTFETKAAPLTSKFVSDTLSAFF